MSAKLMTKSKKKSGAKTAAAPANATAAEASAKQAKLVKTKSDEKPKRLSALDAAAQVLKAVGKPMRAQELITAMAEKGLWPSPKGKTPHATLCRCLCASETNTLDLGWLDRRPRSFGRTDCQRSSFRTDNPCSEESISIERARIYKDICSFRAILRSAEMTIQRSTYVVRWICCSEEPVAMPKPVTKFNFTRAAIVAVKPPKDQERVYVYDKRTPALALCVTRGESRTFYVYRRIHGRPVRVRLGRFPEMTIDQARKQAAVVLAEIARGNDPQEQKRALRRQCTLGELFDHYLETHAKVHCREKSWREDQRIFNKHLPVWHARRISTISTADIVALHGRIGKKTPCQANRLLTLLCKLFNYGRRTPKSDRANPCEGVRRFHETTRERFLNEKELKRLFRALASEPEPFRSFFLLLLLTGARKGNVQAMRWQDVDLDSRLWRIPNNQSKNRKPLTVVLSPESVEILQQRRAEVDGAEYVFPGCGKTGHLVEAKTAWGHVVKRAKLNDCRMHDLRQTLGSWQAAGGASLLIIGKTWGTEARAPRAYMPAWQLIRSARVSRRLRRR